MFAGFDVEDSKFYDGSGLNESRCNDCRRGKWFEYIARRRTRVKAAEMLTRPSMTYVRTGRNRRRSWMFRTDSLEQQLFSGDALH